VPDRTNGGALPADMKNISIRVLSWVSDMGPGLIDRLPVVTGVLLRFTRAVPSAP
jgi:hypothetical protein